MRCGHATRKGTPCQNLSGRCRHHPVLPVVEEGEGLREVLHTLTKPIHNVPWLGPRIKHTLEGPRKIATKRFTKFLETEGNQPIVKLEIARKKIEGPVETALNVLSLGGFNKVKKKLSYDKVYHNYLLATMADGRTFVVHKNHVVESRAANKDDLQNEKYNIALPTDRTLTLKEMFDRALNTDKGEPASEDSKRRLIQYDPSVANCQFFTQEMLGDNGLTPTDPEALKFIEPQNSKALINSLGPLAPVAKFVTDTAATLDRTVHGDGLANINFKLRPPRIRKRIFLKQQA